MKNTSAINISLVKPDPDDLFIYGVPSNGNKIMQLHLTRLFPPSPPRPPAPRPPRPDDPTPRNPAALLRLTGSPGRRGLKRVRSESAMGISQREVERKKAKGKVILDIKGKSRFDAQGFKIPDDPFLVPAPPSSIANGDEDKVELGEQGGNIFVLLHDALNAHVILVCEARYTAGSGVPWYLQDTSGLQRTARLDIPWRIIRTGMSYSTTHAGTLSILPRLLEKEGAPESPSALMRSV